MMLFAFLAGWCFALQINWHIHIFSWLSTLSFDLSIIAVLGHYLRDWCSTKQRADAIFIFLPIRALVVFVPFVLLFGLILGHSS